LNYGVTLMTMHKLEDALKVDISFNLFDIPA